eukprot:scaffold4205_cov48-Cylindrotheca_fusiformis.AAC.2
MGDNANDVEIGDALQQEDSKSGTAEELLSLQFGVSAATASRVYADLQKTVVEEARIQGDNNQLRFFLMGLYYLRKYPTEDDLASRFNYSNFWAREKVWGTAKRIRALKAEKIVWDNDGIGPWYISVDGTHCASAVGADVPMIPRPGAESRKRDEPNWCSLGQAKTTHGATVAVAWSKKK